MQSLDLLKTFKDDTVENDFQKLQAKLLSQMEIQGRQDGIANKPVDQRMYDVRIKNVKATVQSAINQNYSNNQMVSDLAVAQKMRTTADDEASRYEKEKNGKEKELVVAKKEEEDLKGNQKNTLSVKLRIFIAALFGTGEGVLVLNLLQSAAFPGIGKYMLALLIALSATVGLGLSARFIKRAKTKIQQRIRYCVVTGLAVIAASALGLWRSSLYSQTVSINSSIDLSNQAIPEHFSAFPFILISIISFLTALAFELKYYLSDDDLACLKKCKKKSQQVKKLEGEFNALTEKINCIKRDSTLNSALVLRRSEYANNCEQRLVNLAQQAISVYEEVNLEHRRDNKCPSFFGHIHNRDFKLHFASVFSNIKKQQQ